MSEPHFIPGEGWTAPQGGLWEGLCELFLLLHFGVPERGLLAASYSVSGWGSCWDPMVA